MNVHIINRLSRQDETQAIIEAGMLQIRKGQLAIVTAEGEDITYLYIFGIE